MMILGLLGLLVISSGFFLIALYDNGSTGARDKAVYLIDFEHSIPLDR